LRIIVPMFAVQAIVPMAAQAPVPWQAAADRAQPLAHNGHKVGLVRKLVREVLTQLAG
jgi:hypothetical protein